MSPRSNVWTMIIILVVQARRMLFSMFRVIAIMSMTMAPLDFRRWCDVFNIVKLWTTNPELKPDKMGPFQPKFNWIFNYKTTRARKLQVKSSWTSNNWSSYCLSLLWLKLKLKLKLVSPQAPLKLKLKLKLKLQIERKRKAKVRDEKKKKKLKVERRTKLNN